MYNRKNVLSLIYGSTIIFGENIWISAYYARYIEPGIGDLKPSHDAKKESHDVVRRTPIAEGEGFKPPIP